MILAGVNLSGCASDTLHASNVPKMLCFEHVLKTIEKVNPLTLFINVPVKHLDIFKKKKKKKLLLELSDELEF